MKQKNTLEIIHTKSYTLTIFDINYIYEYIEAKIIYLERKALLNACHTQKMHMI